MSLGTFGTSFAARAEAARRIEGGKWIRGEVSVPVHGVTIFERSPRDGFFYAAQSIPFERRIIKNIPTAKGPFLLQDAVASMSRNFKGTCSGVLSELHRAVQSAAGQNAHTELSVYGSCAIGAALPTLSDIDVVVNVTSVGSNGPPLLLEDIKFLGDVANRVKVSRGWSAMYVR